MKKHLPWLAALIIITIVFETSYAMVQQSLRLSANDPQVQLAEEIAARLDNGVKPADVLISPDVAGSLMPFVVVYDRSGNSLARFGSLSAQFKVPAGVLTSSQGRTYNAVTWQLTEGTRLASVTVAADEYYVTAARSLKDTEDRENTTLLLAGIGWLVSVVVFGTAYWLTARR